MNTQPTHLTTEQLAERLKRKPGTLANWRGKGIGPRFLPGRPVLYAIADVEQWECDQKRGAPVSRRPVRPMCDQATGFYSFLVAKPT